MTNSPENPLSIITLIISILALLISIGDFFIARRALKLNEIEGNEKKPNIVPYLIDSIAVNFKDYKLFAFYFSLSNRSTNSNSISEIELKIIYSQNEHNIGNLIFRHDGILNRELSLPGHQPFSTPTEIGANQTITGWGLFRVPHNLLKEKRVENYEIKTRDTHAIETVIVPILIKEKDFDEK